MSAKRKRGKYKRKQEKKKKIKTMIIGEVIYSHI